MLNVAIQLKSSLVEDPSKRLGLLHEVALLLESSIKIRFGMPPHQYIMKIRVDKAKALLAGSRASQSRSRCNAVLPVGLSPRAYRMERGR